MKCWDWAEVKHKCLEESSLEGKEIKNTLVITFSFQVVFTAFNALQNLHSSLHDEESLGLICLSIIYFTAIVSSVLSPTIIGLLGAKTVLVAFFLAHSVYVLANFYPSFVTMVPAAVALGAFNGPAWTSQALYISANAFSFSKTSSTSPYTILSRFNGFFFACFATTQIVGNLVTSTVIRDGVGNKSDETIIFKYCGIDDCPDNENVTEIEDPEDWVIDITLGFFMSCCLFGLLLVFFLLSPLPRSDWIQKASVRFTATSCFSVLLTTDMLLLVPFILFTSVEHAFLMASFTKAYVTCAIGIHMVGYVMASYGATTPFFVFLFIRLARIAGRFLLLSISLAAHILLLAFLYLWAPTSDDEALIFVIPMFWGVAESILLAQANSLITMLYPSQKEPAFANFHAWRSLGYSITFMNATYLCVSTKLILCMICATLGLILYIFVELKTKMREKLVLENRSSVISVPTLDVELNSPEDVGSLKRISTTSLRSIQERLSFSHTELHEVITEAQAGWRRDESGLTLEVSKVMSSSYLKESKATTLYHTCASLTDLSVMDSHHGERPQVLPRSLSENAAETIRFSYLDSRYLRGAPSVQQKRRAVSEIISPSFNILKEVVLEEEDESSDEFIMIRGEPGDEDDVFVGDPLHRTTLGSDSIQQGFTSTPGETIHSSYSVVSLKRGKHEPALSKVKFTVRPDSDTHICFEDETSPKDQSVQSRIKSIQNNLLFKKRRSGLDLIRRPYSLSNMFSKGSTPTANGLNNKTIKTQSKNCLDGENKGEFHSSAPNKVSFFKKSKSLEPPASISEKLEEVEERSKSYDEDSDGFVSDEELQKDDEIIEDIAIEKIVKRRPRMPAMECEDVTCIY